MQNKATGPRYTLSPELKVALAKAEGLNDEKEKIETALTKARKDAATATAELEAARAALAEVESSAALNGSTPDPKVRRTVSAARDTAEALEARVRGLSGRLEINAGALAEAQQGVQSAWQAWIVTVAGDVYAELQQAAEAFRVKLQVAAAIGSALDIRRAVSASRDAAFFDPANPGVNMLNPTRFRWQSNPAAVAMHEELSNLRAPLARYLTPAEVPEAEPTEVPAA